MGARYGGGGRGPPIIWANYQDPILGPTTTIWTPQYFPMTPMNFRPTMISDSGRAWNVQNMIFLGLNMGLFNLILLYAALPGLVCCVTPNPFVCQVPTANWTRGQSNLTKSASQGAHSPVRGHPRPRGSKFVPLNSWGRGSY